MNRQPAVAGSFYPANPEQLHLMLDQYLNDAATDAKSSQSHHRASCRLYLFRPRSPQPPMPD